MQQADGMFKKEQERSADVDAWVANRGCGPGV